jgi:hypothetical protein
MNACWWFWTHIDFAAAFVMVDGRSPPPDLLNNLKPPVFVTKKLESSV